MLVTSLECGTSRISSWSCPLLDIHGLDCGILSAILKFANDTELFGIVTVLL